MWSGQPISPVQIHYHNHIQVVSKEEHFTNVSPVRPPQ
jgi:hypothetical protein